MEVSGGLCGAPAQTTADMRGMSMRITSRNHPRRVHPVGLQTGKHWIFVPTSVNGFETFTLRKKRITDADLASYFISTAIQLLKANIQKLVSFTAMESTSMKETERNCVLCCQDLEIFALGKCDHPVCYCCSTKMRVLCDQKYCAVCREELDKVGFPHHFISGMDCDSVGRTC